MAWSEGKNQAPQSFAKGPRHTAFREAKERAGIDPKLRWHDLRHISISLIIMSGVDCNTVAALVGHTTATMIETTSGLLPLRHMQATAVTFGGYLDRITGLGSAQGSLQPMNSDRPVSAQVADLISGEAARGIPAANLLPDETKRLSIRPATPSGPGEK